MNTGIYFDGKTAHWFCWRGRKVCRVPRWLCKLAVKAANGR